MGWTDSNLTPILAYGDALKKGGHMVAISCAASRRHFFRARGTLLVAFVLAASGCASSRPVRAHDQGKVIGTLSLLCGPFYFHCALTGIGVVGTADRLTKSSEDTPPEEDAYIDRIEESDFSPTGSLFVEIYRVQGTRNGRTGTLLVNLDDPDEQGTIETDVEGRIKRK